ncbi:MAG: DUF2804 domain-containing protein [Phycisphaerae bacterium]|nr:DUF2804 domain-containing protein [Phycisphaerae bacterium]
MQTFWNQSSQPSPSSHETPGLSRRTLLRWSGATTLALALDRLSKPAFAAQAVPDELVLPELDDTYEYLRCDIVEITAPGPIVLPDGTSVASWSRRPYLDLNFEDAAFYPVRSAQQLRMKKWDMLHMVTPTHYVVFLIAWIGWAGFCTAHVYSRKTGKFLDDAQFRPPHPPLEMMRTSMTGRSVCAGKRASMTFDFQDQRRHISVDWPRFAGVGLTAEILLTEPPGHESICATHLTSPKRAYYSHKINCMPASGTVRLGDETIPLRPEDSFGMLDYGRGYYPARTFWYWATASGIGGDGKRLGWNLGHANDPDDHSENAVFHDGKCHKIGPVRCEVPRDDPMRPWRVRTTDGRVDLTFTPKTVRTMNVQIGPLHSKGHPVYGLYSGHVRLDDGARIDVKDLFGLYEWFDQKW